MLAIAAFVLLVIVVFALGWIVAITGTGQAVEFVELTDLERAFTERMQNVALVGHFTFEGREQLNVNQERYEIDRVTKVDDKRWRFDVHMTYMTVDATLPVTVPIMWAGDTPMVSITDMSIPGLGHGFTARVFFYEDRYAGRWKHGEVGGLMYGTIEPMDAN